MSDDDGSCDPMAVFVEESRDDNLQIQIESIRRLQTLALSLGEERVRKELVPYLEEFVATNYIHDEILLHVSEQLESFIPLVGGFEHAETVLGVLEKLCAIDETIVRERAVESLKNITKIFTDEQIETNFVPLVRKLSRQDWFTTKCSATGLFAIIYPRVSEEKRNDLREWFTNLIQDDSPMVRRSASVKFVDFAQVLDVDDVKNTFLPILDNLVKDAQDSVRILAVGVAVSIALKLSTKKEVEELVWKNLKSLGDDPSWRVRCQVATEITEIQKALGVDVNRNNLLILYHNLVRDVENQVREAAAKNFANFCRILMEESKIAQIDFDEIFHESLMPMIKELYTDPSDEVRIAFSSILMSLSTFLNPDIVKSDVLPVIKAMIEMDTSSQVKENIIKNLDSLIDVVGFDDIINSVHLLIEDLVCKSESQWRTRRSILVTFAHVAKHSGKQYFNDHLMDIYLKLINDPVFAVRKTAPLIFPVLVKYFGMSWALKFLLPQIFDYISHVNYLYRFITLFGIDEFVQPTLLVDDTKSDTSRYLSGLEKLCHDEDVVIQQNAIYVLVKLIKLEEILKSEFEQAWIQEGFEGIDQEDYFNDDIKTYAEETLENFSKDCDLDVFDITKKEITAEEQENSYLEGVLIFCINHFLGAVHKLLQDPIPNVQIRAKRTLLKIHQFSNDFEKELTQNWVKDVLQKIPEEDVAKIQEKLKEELLQNTLPNATKSESTKETVFDNYEEIVPEKVFPEEMNNNEKTAEDLETNPEKDLSLENDIVQILDEKIATIL